MKLIGTDGTKNSKKFFQPAGPEYYKDKILRNSMRIKPKTKLGKWSVYLNTFFLIVIIISIILVKVFGILNFDDHWWDVTVPIVFLSSIVGFILGIIAIRKKDNSFLVYASVVVGLLAILFIPLHSLFIND